MSTNNNNNKNQDYGIEKFEGSFDKEDLGVTIIPTDTLNQIKNAEALGVYVYLLGRPNGWNPNVKQLKTHFDCTKERIYAALNYLLDEGFMSKTVIRSGGKFVKHHYRVHLHRLKLSTVESTVESTVDQVDEILTTQAQTEVSPLPGKPDTGKPDTGNPDAYKTYSVKSIDCKKHIKKPIVDSSKSTAYKSYLLDALFMTFYKVYPNKQKPYLAYKAFLKQKPDQDFVDMLVNDISQRMANNWKDRHKSKIPFPSRYLNDREWEGEIYTAEHHEGTQYTNGKSPISSKSKSSLEKIDGIYYFNGHVVE